MAEIYLDRGQSALVYRAPQPANPRNTTYTALVTRLGEDQFLWVRCGEPGGMQGGHPRTVLLERGQSVLVSHAQPDSDVPTVKRERSPQGKVEIEIGGSGG